MSTYHYSSSRLPLSTLYRSPSSDMPPAGFHGNSPQPDYILHRQGDPNYDLDHSFTVTHSNDDGSRLFAMPETTSVTQTTYDFGVPFSGRFTVSSSLDDNEEDRKKASEDEWADNALEKHKEEASPRKAAVEKDNLNLRPVKRNRESDKSGRIGGEQGGNPPLLASTVPISDIIIHGRFRKTDSDGIVAEESSGISRGLENLVNQNNCFVNVVIQSLWHLRFFRDDFRPIVLHNHVEPCVFCALQAVFNHYHYSEDAIIPPDILRNTLSALYFEQNRFQVGTLGDAAEVYEAILNSIHRALRSDQENCEPPCLAHQCFGMSIVETIVCECTATSEPLIYNQFLQNVAEPTIRSLGSSFHGIGVGFDKLLGLSIQGDERKCPTEKCNRRAKMERALISSPMVFVVCIGWSTDEPERDAVKDVVNRISLSIDLNNIFANRFDGEMLYELSGCVCYYGRHYVAFMKVKGSWIEFDDKTVKKVADHWHDVAEEIRKSKWQPQILWFTKLSPPSS